MQPTDAARRETQVALQEQAPNDRNKTSDFIAYPINKVVGFIDDLGDVKAALGDLRAAGFKAEDIQVLTGEEGAHRIDVNGDEHGEWAHIVRSIQKTLGDYEIPHAKRHEQAPGGALRNWSYRQRGGRPEQSARHTEIA